MKLYAGGHAQSVAGDPVRLGGCRCFSPVHPPPRWIDPEGLRILLDSGAFSDPPEARPSLEAALARQLSWEQRASHLWGFSVVSEAIVSRDVIIDETWIGGIRHKRRWTVSAADSAVRETVEAAAYLSSRRRDLAPRSLVLACQGVESSQYGDCASAVLTHALPRDWLGLGGWCLLGRAKRLLPEFWRTLRRVLPLAVDAGVRRIHLFGVLWVPALAGLLWMCDQLGLEASCDSAAPILSCTRGDPKKAGVRGEGWRGNLAWWQVCLAGLRGTKDYREPPRELW